MADHAANPNESRVLVFAPLGRDAALACQMLKEAGIASCACADASTLCAQTREGAGCLLLAEEALRPDVVERLSEVTRDQPPWSDLPVIVFARSGESAAPILRTLRDLGNVTILERPVRITTLLSAVQTSLRARRRQYEVRDLLAKLADDSRRKDEFLAMLGHELRNPLAAIHNALRLLELMGPANERARRQQGVIERQVRHLKRMVDDLLDVSRVTLGKVKIQPQVVNLTEVAARSVQALRTFAAERKHRLSVALPPEPILVEGDPVRLEQVISNLLNNAIKYTPPGGSIHLTVEAEIEERGSVERGSVGAGPSRSPAPDARTLGRSYACVRVQDSGIGIAPEMLPRIWDLFAQAERSLARSEGGMGLGLTLVRNLVQMHGGTVEARSAGVNQGSEFVVHLPLAEAPLPQAMPQETPAPQPVAPQGSGPAYRVLVVEDNADGRETLHELLEVCGHEVEVAADGAEGVDKALQMLPHVALVDIGLPKLDGYEVARRIRARLDGNRPYLIAMSGYGQPSDKQRAQDAGFDTHLVKPVDPEDLVALLASIGREQAA